MKKIFFLFFALSFFLNVNAQITLTQSTSTPIIGDSVQYLGQSIVMNVANSGPNQTWDFSGITTGGQLNMSAINLSDSQAPGTFPTATIVEYYQNGTDLYMISSDTEYTEIGMYNPSNQGRTTYTDAKELLKFPLSYQTTFNETYDCEIEHLGSGDIFHRTGTIEITADGFGELILPYITIRDVLRVKVTSTYVTDNNPTHTDINYLWYNLSNRVYIARYYETKRGTVLLQSGANILKSTSLVTSTYQISSNEPTKLTFYPNPAANTIILNNIQGINSISILDFRGQVIKNITVNENNQLIDISELSTGIYCIRYILNKNSYTEKLIVK